MMNKWRRPQYILCTWLAMFSLVVPSFAWNCSPARAANMPSCPLMVQPDKTETAKMDEMPCCAKSKVVVQCPNNCCNPLPQFPGSDHKGGTLEKTHAHGASISQHLAQSAQNIVVISLSPSAPLVIAPTQTRTWNDDAPLLLQSQFAPAPQAGRAPPAQ